MAPITYISGFVWSRQHPIVLGRYDELAQLGDVGTKVLRFSVDGGKPATVDLRWSATCVTALDPGGPIVVVGPEGRLGEKGGPGEIRTEDIWPGQRGPAQLGDIRDLRRIGGNLYATGMNRQVYRRETPGRWTRMDNGIITINGKPGSLDVVGFNSIDGSSEKNIYACGFGGEIAWYDGMQWRIINGITNVILNSVRVVKETDVIICGKMGTLLRGCQDKWRVIEHSITDDEIWDVEEFNGTVYVATDDSLYQLSENDKLEKVNVKLNGTKSFGCLHAAEGMLLSVGDKHVLWTEDGKKWHDISM